MTSMGLDDAATRRLYGFLVDHGPTPIQDLQAAFGQDVDNQLATLREEGYVIGEELPAARAPKRAFDPLLREARRRVQALEHDVEILQDRYNANPANTGPVLVERLTTREEFAKVYRKLDRRTHVEWMQVFTAPFLPAPPFTPPPPDHDPEALPLRRMVYEREILASPGALASIRNAAEWGVRIRIAEKVSTKLIISDRRIALTPEQPRGTLPMLRTTSPALVAGLVAAFEAEWAGAEPLEVDPSELMSVPRDLANDDLMTLQLVIGGEKYETIARTMRCSAKTVQRRVTKMCKLAGVRTRNQLVHYATLHWLR